MTDLNEYIINNKVSLEELEYGDYIFCLLNEEDIIYVGTSMKKYPSLTPHIDKGFTHYISMDTNDIGFTGSMEEFYFYLIFNFVPQYNRVLPPNERYMSKSVIKKRFDINGIELNKILRKNKIYPIYLEYYDIKDIFQYERLDMMGK